MRARAAPPVGDSDGEPSVRRSPARWPATPSTRSWAWMGLREWATVPLPGQLRSLRVSSPSHGPGATSAPSAAPTQPAPQNPNQQAARLLGEAISQVQRVIVGQEHMVEQLMVGLLAKGHILLEGVPGVAKTLAVAVVRDRGRRRLRPHPVHPGPGAVRHRRHPDLQGQPGGLRRRARPGLRQLHPGRRDQPRSGQGAGGDARADGGEAGLDRRSDLPDAAAVHRHRDPEPDRVRGRLPAARGAARPFPAEGRRAVPARATRSSRSCAG